MSLYKLCHEPKRSPFEQGVQPTNGQIRLVEHVTSALTALYESIASDPTDCCLGVSSNRRMVLGGSSTLEACIKWCAAHINQFAPGPFSFSESFDSLAFLMADQF